MYKNTFVIIPMLVLLYLHYSCKKLANVGPMEPAFGKVQHFPHTINSSIVSLIEIFSWTRLLIILEMGTMMVVVNQMVVKMLTSC